MLKNCVVISIQNNFQIFGLRIKAGSDGKYYIQNEFSGTYTEEDGPGEALRYAMSTLNAQNCARIVLTGQIAHSGIFEIRMPKLHHEELRHAIEYELTKYIPLPLSDIIWSARVVPEKEIAKEEEKAEKNDSEDNGENEKEHKDLNRMRVIFMRKDNWDKFISELHIRQLHIDNYINPFMSIDPFASEIDVALPTIDDDHIFLLRKNGLRKMGIYKDARKNEGIKKQLFDSFLWNEEASGLNNLEQYFDTMLVARYIMSGEYDKFESKFAIKLPKVLIPQRNRLLKFFAIVNGIAALLCLFLLLYQKRQGVYRIYVEQKNAINLISKQISDLQKQNAASKKNEKLYKKIISTVPDDPSPLRILASLAQKLPKYIWIRSYNMTADKIHLSLTSSKDPGNLSTVLRDEDLYTIENIRKSRRHDGSYYLYLMLVPPESRGGAK